MQVFEKIKEAIQKEIEDVIVKDIYTKGKNAGLRKAEILVDEAAAEYNNGWIPCSERLPEKKGKYLTTSKIYFVPDHVDEHDNYIGLEITYYSEINGWNGEVIAWQPLPGPYQPKGE